MNKVKKIAFGTLIAGLAFGFSAFTTLNKRGIFVYYKIDMTNPLPNNPSGYYYFTDDRCESGGEVCHAQWNIGSHPVPNIGDPLPTTGVTFQTGSVRTGHFE